MHLTRYTDYALRTLIYLGINESRTCTIAEIAQRYRISNNHLMKIVHQLGKEDLIHTVRGRGGGLRLGRPPALMTVGEVVR
ncbi:MAG: Rrf2 family transcriptional regulator, partial [Alphaproteobacteria bacterium]|nr:Rrf2 family transcriptional regulator [Alphaproteobacteria bacterium]